MQKRVNVTVPLACPHCLTEIFISLDDVRAEPRLQCSRCGTDVELKAEDMVLPAMIHTESEQAFFGIEF
jgi:predicted Zn finger-like uncharacterized protein